MSYLLDSTEIKRPVQMRERNSTQMAVSRTLDGTVRRDYFGANKRVWQLDYKNTNPDAYNVIKAIYDSYLSTGSTKPFAITESAYSVSETQVHVDLVDRGFSVRGETYLSDFSLVLTEA